MYVCVLVSLCVAAAYMFEASGLMVAGLDVTEKKRLRQIRDTELG